MYERVRALEESIYRRRRRRRLYIHIYIFVKLYILDFLILYISLMRAQLPAPPSDVYSIKRSAFFFFIVAAAHVELKSSYIYAHMYLYITISLINV